MLYLQSGKCFFCGRALKAGDASIEHLLPRSKGGGSTEENEVVCCKALNHTFGDMDLKAKFKFALEAAGNFKCPMA
jgi:5-methylcytosine-specific restriction endonuclease McrA